MLYPTLRNAIEDACRHLAAFGNHVMMLAYNSEKQQWGVFNCSNPQGILDYFELGSPRPVALLQHQACLTAMQLPDFKKFDDYLTAFAGTGEPHQMQRSLQPFLDEYARTETESD